MGTTPHGIVYAESSGAPQAWVDSLNMANSIDDKFDDYELFNSWTLEFTGGFVSAGSGGVMEGHYCQIGKLVHAEFRIQVGTSPTFTGTTLDLDLPVPAFVWGGNGVWGPLGSWIIRNNSPTEFYAGSIGLSSTSTGRASFAGAWNGTEPAGRVTNTLPIAFAVDDEFSGTLDYRAA